MNIKPFLISITSFSFIFCTNKSKVDNSLLKNTQPIPEENLPISNKKELGIGFLQVNFLQEIPLYKNTEDSVAIDIIRFKPNEDGRILIKTNKVKLNPYEMYEGDTYQQGKKHIQMGLVHIEPNLMFRVLENSEKHLLIVTNEKTFEKYYIRKKENHNYNNKIEYFMDHNRFTDANWYAFADWENYLKNVEFVDNIQDIYDQPNSNVVLYPAKEHQDQSFNVEGLQEDFIKVQQRWEPKKKGWARWRQGDSLIINIVHITIE